MQFQVDAGDSRPTFFELVATDRLVPSLRAALVYSLRTLAERRPGVTRILDHEAEAFALLMLLVEAHSFATSDGSLAEGLYGLQRVRLGARGGHGERGGRGGRGGARAPGRRLNTIAFMSRPAAQHAPKVYAARADHQDVAEARTRSPARPGPLSSPARRSFRADEKPESESPKPIP